MTASLLGAAEEDGMTPYYQDSAVTIYHGDCREIVPTLGPVDAVVTDPPYSSGGQFRGDRTQKP